MLKIAKETFSENSSGSKLPSIIIKKSDFRKKIRYN